MSAIAALLAEPAIYSFRGKDYSVHPWTFEIQGKFEQYLRRYAIDRHHEIVGLLAPADSDKALGLLMRDINAGKYTFGGELCGEALDSPVHIRFMFFLCLKKHHPEVTRENVDEMAREDYGGMIRAMNVANTDPNRRRAKSPAVETETSTPVAPPSSPDSPA